MARKVVDRGPCEMMPPPPACARTGWKVTCTGRRPSRGFCQHRPFFTQTTVLTAKLAYLLTLCGAQSISVPACVTVSLRDPVADRLGGRFEFTSQPLRSPPGASQGDAQTIWRRKAGGYGGLDFGMVDTSSPKGQGSTKAGQLHTPVPDVVLRALANPLVARVPPHPPLRAVQQPRRAVAGTGRQKRCNVAGAPPHMGLQRRRLVHRADAFEEIVEALRPGNGCGSRRTGQKVRIDPLGELGEHRRHLIQSADALFVADKIDRRRLDAGNQDRSARRVEALDRHLGNPLAGDEGDPDDAARYRTAITGEGNLEYLRTVMRRAVILGGGQGSRGERRGT